MAASVAFTSSLAAGKSICKPWSVRPTPSLAPQRRAHHRIITKAGLTDTGYILADAVSKVADKADKAVGSVDAPGWVLPVSAVAVGVVLTASSLLLKPGVDAQQKMADRDANKWNK